MDVTKNEIKDRQLHNEGYQQMVSAEHILQSDHLDKAYKKVKSNKGAVGVDGMSVDELQRFSKTIKCNLFKS